MIKNRLLLGAVALQVLILLAMAGHREWIARTGKTVYFRTAPVDPRDYMRGDYVRLNYSMSLVPRSQCRGALATVDSLPEGTRVYALLKEVEGVAKLVSLGLDRPKDGLVIRGRLEQVYPHQVSVRYGIEAFFMEQGQGLELERGRNVNGIQVPLEMETALGSQGIPVLKGYRWCDLGIGLNVQTTNVLSDNGARMPRLLGAEVVLVNAGSNDLAIVDLPNDKSFHLVPVSPWQPNPWEWTPPDQPAPIEPSHLVALKPGQAHTNQLSFREPRWVVVNSQKPGPPQLLAEIQPDWSTAFRIEYRSPNRAVSSNLPNANLIWHGELQSRQFNLGGGID